MQKRSQQCSPFEFLHGVILILVFALSDAETAEDSSFPTFSHSHSVFPFLQSSVVIPIEIDVELMFLLPFPTNDPVYHTFRGNKLGNSEFFCHRNRNVSLIE